MSLHLNAPPKEVGGKSYEGGGDWIKAADKDVPDDLRVVGSIDDDAADYSFDDWVLAFNGAGWWLFAASGCSCPSHEETARLEIGPAPLSDVRAHIEGGHYDGYTLPKRQAAQFAELFTHAEKAGATP